MLHISVLTFLFTLCACKSEAVTQNNTTPQLVLQLLDLDAAVGPREGRPFVAGETATIALRVSGGEAPYDVQVVTQAGAPTFASGSTRVEVEQVKEASVGQEGVTVGMNLRLGSQVPSGAYQLLFRVSDAVGNSASLRSTLLEVVGEGAELAAPPQGPFGLQVVDVSGRRRLRFYQGEEIHIRARVPLRTRGPGSEDDTISVSISAEDERTMMPVQTYRHLDAFTDLPLRVPRLARVGVYQVQLVTDEQESTVPLHVIGRQFRSASKPVLEDLRLRGGTNFRIAQGALLPRGKPMHVEALVGGVATFADAELRLRDRAGQVVVHMALDTIVPADPHPEARSLLSATWTPPIALRRGRHVLELEVSEGAEMATLFREVLVQ